MSFSKFRLYFLKSRFSRNLLRKLYKGKEYHFFRSSYMYFFFPLMQPEYWYFERGARYHCLTAGGNAKNKE